MLNFISHLSAQSWSRRMSCCNECEFAKVYIILHTGRHDRRASCQWHCGIQYVIQVRYCCFWQHPGITSRLCESGPPVLLTRFLQLCPSRFRIVLQFSIAIYFSEVSLGVLSIIWPLFGFSYYLTDCLWSTMLQAFCSDCVHARRFAFLHSQASVQSYVILLLVRSQFSYQK